MGKESAVTSATLGRSERENRLDEILAELIQKSEAGEAPQLDDVLAKHPEFATELREYFDDQACFDKAARPFLEQGNRLGIEQTLQLGDQPLLATMARAPQVGSKLRYFGDYELLQEIARGGMGVVYKARQVKLNRVVAIKMILTGQRHFRH